MDAEETAARVSAAITAKADHDTELPPGNSREALTERGLHHLRCDDCQLATAVLNLEWCAAELGNAAHALKGNMPDWGSPLAVAEARVTISIDWLPDTMATLHRLLGDE